MIVERWTFHIKPGQVDEAVDLLFNERMYTARPEHIAVSKVLFGSAGRVMWACVFDSLGQHEQFWKEWNDSPRRLPFLEKFRLMTEFGGEREIWELK